MNLIKVMVEYVSIILGSVLFSTLIERPAFLLNRLDMRF